MSDPHDDILSGLTNQPTRQKCVIDAVKVIEKRLRHFAGLPENIGIVGLVLEPLMKLYNAGERRGIARESNPVTALFPVSDFPFDDANGEAPGC